MELPQEQPLCLQGLFVHLVEKGFRLSVRDYIDALRALRAGYGTLDRDNLLWLCRALWARTPEEERYLHYLFEQIPLPTTDEVDEIISAFRASAKQQVDRAEDPKRQGRKKRPSEEPEDEDALGATFVPPTQRGLGVPRAHVEATHTEDFILTPKPLIPMRDLVVVFRRFRRAVRTGPRVELDIEATIDETCRMGLLEAPVLVPARRNQARLTVLVDVSKSMAPWRTFNAVLRDALRHSNLGNWAVFYFKNVPGKVLFEQETLYKRRPIETLLKERPGTPLLMISDGGAARGFHSTRRIVDTQIFLRNVRKKAWRPVAWVNPMPQHRWQKTSAQAIIERAAVPMFELTKDGLIQAIDVLRGTKLRGG